MLIARSLVLSGLLTASLTTAAAAQTGFDNAPRMARPALVAQATLPVESTALPTPPAAPPWSEPAAAPAQPPLPQVPAEAGTGATFQPPTAMPAAPAAAPAGAPTANQLPPLLSQVAPQATTLGARGVKQTPVPSYGSLPPPLPPIASQKPFAGYTPAPVLSPYINLARTDTGLGMINNYYSLVRPMQQQQELNRQTQQTIRELRTFNMMQQTQVEQLQRQNNLLLNRPTGSSFMNFNQYYPGLGR